MPSSPILSDKAKGKQRATVPLDAGEGSSELPRKKKLVIRFSEGVQDLTLEVAERDSVRDVKRNIRDARPQLKSHRLRLIHSGRLLTDGTFLYSWLESLEERQRRASATVADDTPDNSSTTWLHCSVGPLMESGEEDEAKVQEAQLKPLRGFDRLAAAGFSEEDIANIRSQFHSQSSGNFLDEEFSNEQDFDEHARALEEQWIDSMDNVGTASISQSSSHATSVILNGIVLGFFFPLLPLFFFHEAKPAVFWEEGPDHSTSNPSIFSKKLQMGIVIGFLMNIVFGIWTYLLSAE